MAANLTLQLDGQQSVQITALPLTADAFAPFGSVISNPRPDVHPSKFSSASRMPANAFSANQGNAIQYRHAGRPRNLYDQSPSGRADAALSMFVCSARDLEATDAEPGLFPVRFLERHPFTTQTFAPVASSAGAYLVVVAPSLTPGDKDANLPAPKGADLPGPGMPDLNGLKAFVATDAQAVTYGAGTWHAPMVVLGQAGTTLDFVVSQWMSGVPVEDCQLLELVSRREEHIVVRVPKAPRLGKL